MNQVTLLFCFVLLIFSKVNAEVKFSRSWIMDEFDLSAQKMVEMHKCLTKSCKFYVSAPESSWESLDNINCGESTLGAMARSVDLVTGEKRYSAKAFMKNLNANHTCDPVVVYIVREGASMYNSARVFEPRMGTLKIDWQKDETITILSAEPFTVSATQDGGLVTGSVYTTGYDNILENEDHCKPVYELPQRDTFKFSVTGPIATLYRETFGHLELTVENKFEVIPDSATFLTSNGYIGCKNGKVPIDNLFAHNSRKSRFREYYIHTSAYLNTLNDFVTIRVDGQEAASIKGAIGQGQRSWNKTLDFHGKELDIRFEGTKPQFASFLLRFWTGDEPLTYGPTSPRFTHNTQPFTGTTSKNVGKAVTTTAPLYTIDYTTSSSLALHYPFLLFAGLILAPMF